jgi:hydroxymethylglutaryl-CoA lyase
MRSVSIVEVAPRDGFQAVKRFIPTDEKIRIVDALGAAGLGRMEIGAFVSPKALPQMADIREVMARATLPDAIRLQALVPNGKGIHAAIEAGIREISWVVSVTESHNQSNVRRSVDDSFKDFERTWPELGRGLVLRFNLATSFDCPFEGRTPEERVIGLVERVLTTVSDVEIAICDTTGRAAPNHVHAMFEMLHGRFARPGVTFAFHGHDTYNVGVANAIAAYDAGVRVIDGAAAGLGGCPFAPGASGNTATEDLVFAFEHMGIATGVDLAKLLPAADLSRAVAPEQAGGRIQSVPRRRALAGFGAATRGFPGEQCA